MMNKFYVLNQVPAVLRARNFRLYTNGGRRLVDLWQNGGAAILGHTPPSLLRALKNTAGRGLYAPLPHFMETGYIKALARVFPGREFRLYAAPPPELETLAAAGSAALWRPFTDPAAPLAVPENAPPVLIPVVPGIQGWRDNLPYGLCALAVEPDCAQTASLPPADFLSPVLLAAAARGIYDLVAAAPARANPAYPRVAKALKKNAYWQRQGLYLWPRQTPDDEDWAALFSRFLAKGFLLPPLSSQPAILPGELSPGEEAHLAALLDC
jgi:hypothetical protein